MREGLQMVSHAPCFLIFQASEYQKTDWSRYDRNPDDRPSRWESSRLYGKDDEPTAQDKQRDSEIEGVLERQKERELEREIERQRRRELYGGPDDQQKSVAGDNTREVSCFSFMGLCLCSAPDHEQVHWLMSHGCLLCLAISVGSLQP